MSIALPEGLNPDDEIQVEWDNDDLGVKVTASLGEAEIVITTSHEQSGIVPWLVASLPTILEAAWAAIEADQEDEEPTSE